MYQCTMYKILFAFNGTVLACRILKQAAGRSDSCNQMMLPRGSRLVNVYWFWRYSCNMLELFAFPTVAYIEIYIFTDVSIYLTCIYIWSVRDITVCVCACVCTAVHTVVIFRTDQIGQQGASNKRSRRAFPRSSPDERSRGALPWHRNPSGKHIYQRATV